jgi:hypothetical protein
VKECPVPTARIRSPAAAAWPTVSINSVSLAGRSIASGAHRCWPAQFCQISGTAGQAG